MMQNVSHGKSPLGDKQQTRRQESGVEGYTYIQIGKGQTYLLQSSAKAWALDKHQTVGHAFGLTSAQRIKMCRSEDQGHHTLAIQVDENILR